MCLQLKSSSPAPDPEREAFSLSVWKQIGLNLWNLVGEKYPHGTILTGYQEHHFEFGCLHFEDGIDGLIHVPTSLNSRRPAILNEFLLRHDTASKW